MGKKVLVISDNHGSRINLEKVTKRWGSKIDAMVHCGDSESTPEYLKSLVPVPVYVAQGNCDFGFEGDRESIFELEGHVCFVTHGHRYGANWGDGGLVERAMEMGADVLFYGHTHVPDWQVYEEEHVTLINPGSVARPRQYPPECTYMIVEFSDDGQVMPQLYTIPT